MMTTKAMPWVTQAVRCAAHLAIGREDTTDASRPGQTSTARSSRSFTTRRSLFSTARTRSPTSPSIIVAQVSVASENSIQASMRPICKDMATIMTAAEKEYSMNRSQVPCKQNTPSF